MFVPKALVVFSFVLYAHALTTHHIARPLHHRAISARFVAPVADAQPVQPRRLSKRCKPRSSLPQTSSTASNATSSTSPPEQPHSSAPHTTYTPPPTTTTHTTSSPPPPPPSTSTTHASQPTTTSSSSDGNEPSFMIGIQVGEGTYYATGLGACGITNNDSQYIAAVSHLLFDAFPGYNDVNPNKNPVCGRQVKVNYQGASVTVTITDRCTGCALTDLDFSPAAFNQLANPSVGRLLGIQWEWVS